MKTALSLFRRPVILPALFLFAVLLQCKFSKQPSNMIYEVNGILHLENGRPLDEATVMVVEGDADFPDIACITDESGSFGLSLKKGTYKLMIQKENSEWYIPIDVHGVSDTLTFNWVLPGN
jgi:hypothetical protein